MKIRTLKDNKKDLSFIILWLIYFLVTLILFYNQASHFNGKYICDIDAYIRHAFGENAGVPLPYPVLFWTIKKIGIFTSREFATTLAIAILNGLTPICLKYFWDKHISWDFLHEKKFFNNILLFSLFFVSAIYVPSFSSNMYLGQGTPNPWHNATILATRSFSILSFFLFITIWKTYMTAINFKLLLTFSFFTFMTTLAKPSFTFVFIPAAGIVLLFDLIKNKFSNFKRLLIVGLTFIPTFILLIWQYIETFFYYGTEIEGGIGIAPGQVWNLYTTNIFISVILGLLFPIIILCWNFKEYKRKKLYLLTVTMLITGFLECFLFVEKGIRMNDGNFFWGYYHSMSFAFILALIIFCNTYTKRGKLYQFLGIIIYSIHFITGVCYFLKIFMGGSYV